MKLITSKMPFAKRSGTKLAHQKKKHHRKDKIDDNSMNNVNNMINEEQEGQNPTDAMRNDAPLRL